MIKNILYAVLMLMVTSCAFPDPIGDIFPSSRRVQTTDEFNIFYPNDWSFKMQRISDGPFFVKFIVISTYLDYLIQEPLTNENVIIDTDSDGNKFVEVNNLDAIVCSVYDCDAKKLTKVKVSIIYQIGIIDPPVNKSRSGTKTLTLIFPQED